MHLGKVLFELQEIDLALAAHARRLQQITDLLADHVAVQAAQQQVEEAEAALHPLQTHNLDLELQIQSTRDKRSSTENRLYGGSVTNPKELQDMQHEIEALKKWQNELEDRLLDVMVDIEEAETVLHAARENLDSVTQKAASENKDLLAEQQQLQTETTRLQSQRNQVASDIDAALLSRYEDMRPQKGNQPIAHLTTDDTCSACGVRQTGIIVKDIRRGDTLINCANCKRILVVI